MQFTCEFCKNTFRTKSSLSNHQRKARYCLDNRKKKDQTCYVENKLKIQTEKQKNFRK